MKKTSKILALALMLVLVFSAFACGGSKEPEWGTIMPVTGKVGQVVTVSPVSVTVDGKQVTPTITVKDSAGNVVGANVFVPATAGTYTIIYSVEVDGKTYTQTSYALITASDSGDDKPTPTPTSGIWSIFGTMEANGSETDLTVDGNKVTIKRALAESDYKGVIFRNVNAKGYDADQTHIDLTITNNTGAPVEFYYKATTNSGKDAGQGAGVGYTEHKTAPAGGSATLTCQLFTYDQSNTGATEISQVEIFIITTASSGTITVSIAEHTFN